MAQAQVWGLGLVAGLEHPARWGGLVDLPGAPDERTAARLCAVLGGSEDQVALRPSGAFGRRLVRAPAAAADAVRSWKPRGTALVTSEGGALGPYVAGWLADHGCGHVVLAGPHGDSDPEIAALRERLARAGAELTLTGRPVTDREALAAAVRRQEQTGDPVRAVVHAAVHLDLASLDATTPEAVAVKAGTAGQLDELFAGADLDAFVLFSSVAGVWGSADHAAYGAANAHLDALAGNRRARGLPATAVAWGLWQPVGGPPPEADRERAQGLGRLAPGTALAAMRQAIDHDDTAVAVAEIDWERFVPVFTSARPRPPLTELDGAAGPEDEEGGGSALLQKLSGLSGAERRRALLDLVRAEAAAVLGHSSAADVQPGQAFRDLGFDSLTSVELRNRMKAASGLRLPATVVFDHPTPHDLADHLLAEVFGAAAAGPAAGPAATGGADDPVAIVAMSCRFPGGVGTPEDLWRLVAAGRDAVAPFPADRGWDLEGLYDPDPDRPGTSYVREGGFLGDVAGFDAGFFGISPREALAMDPQQRLLLETSWEALERAGIDPGSLRGTRAGVFVGTNTQDYAPLAAAAGEAVEGYVGIGSSASVMSGRISYTLGLEGPAVTIDTACSASLVGLHQAVRALRAGECTLALVGGAVVMSSPGMHIEFSRQGALSTDGRCRAFSGDAAGTGLSEGVGMLVVEPLSAARRNGHPVLAVIEGTAVNQDGASNGLSAPSGPAQRRVIRQALADAGLTPADIDAVEAHGTGTRLGDPIEAQAIIATYGRDRPEDRPLWLGSLKSNIGHTQAAAGVAGVIKMVMALRNQTLPKTLHVGEPSPLVDWDGGGLRLLDDAVAWRPDGRTRRAGVSAFGISGTNAHVILGEPPAPDAAEAADAAGPAGPAPDAAVPLPVSGRTAAAVRAQARRLHEHLADRPELSPADVGHSLAATRSAFDHRAVVVGTGRAALLDGLSALAGDAPPPEGPAVVQGVATAGPAVVFVFPGQGSQWEGMGRELLETSPAFAARMNDCAEAFEPYIDWPLLDAVRGGPGAPSLERIDVVQPALMAMMVSLAAAWRAHGVEPDAVVGTSQGEIAAACVAGAISLGDAARIIGLRSRLLAERMLGRGALASVALPRDEVSARLARWAGRLETGGVNGPRLVTVAGEAAALEELAAELTAEGVRVRRVANSVATHCAQVDGIRPELLRIVEPVTVGPPGVPFYSTVTGRLMDRGALDAEYWYSNTREPVLFESATRALLDAGHTVFIEISPHPVAGVGLQETLDETGAEAVVTGSLHRGQGGPDRLLTSIAEAHVRGVAVDWSAAFGGARTVELPTYAFQRRRYWPDTTARAAADLSSAGQTSAAHPLLAAGLPLAGSAGAGLFTGRVAAATHPWLAGGLGDAALVETLIRAGDEAGCDTLDEVIVRTPLTVPDAGALRVQVRVDAPGPDGRGAATVHSRAEDAPDDAPWTVHATATLAARAPEGAFDLRAWPPPGAEPDGDGVWRRGEEVFTEVALDTGRRAEASRYGLHPALLDGALRPVVTGPLRPHSYRGVALLATGATALRVRLAPVAGAPDEVSMQAADHTGTPVAFIEAVALRPPEAPDGPDRSVADSMHAPDWTGLPASASTATGLWAVVGDDPFGLASALTRAGADVVASADLAGVPPADRVLVSIAPGPRAPDSAAAARASLNRALDLVRRWLEEDRFADAALVVVTRGAVATDSPDLVTAPVWGLISSAQSENPDRIVLVDLDDDEASYRTLPSALRPGGEPRIALRGGTVLGRRLRRAPLPPETAAPGRHLDGTVMITGTAGALGGLVARHLVTRHGVRRLLLAGRSGPASPRAAELEAELTELGAQVTTAACDVADRAALAALLESLPAGRPVTAVVHAAGVLDDGVIGSLTPERLDRVLRPKMDGALNLHELVPDAHLILFSSSAAPFGSPGQGNYAAANTFLNALARHRRARGLPAVALGWGYWTQRSSMAGHLDQVDLERRMARNGIKGLSAAQGLALFDAALAAAEPVLLPMRLDLAVLRTLAASGTLPHLLRGLVRAPVRRRVDESAPAGGRTFGDRLAGLAGPERDQAVLDTVCEVAAAALGHGSAEEIRPDRPFKELGFDSLASIQLRNRLGAATGIRLRATVVFDFPTPAATARHLCERLFPAREEAADFDSMDVDTLIDMALESGR